MKLFSKEGTKSPLGALEDGEAFDAAQSAPEDGELSAPEAPAKRGFLHRSGRGGGSGKKLSKKGKIILIAVIAAAAVLGVCAKLFWFKGATAAANVSYSAAVVQKRDISVTLSGSGTLAAANSYNVTSLVSGEVTAANFQKGDTVKAGDVLYQIDRIFEPGRGRGVRWNDPAFGIEWPAAPAVISPRDAGYEDG